MRHVLSPLVAACLLLGAAARAEPVVVDEQANHANGSVMVVRAIEVRDDTIRVDLSVTTAGKEIKLNRNSAMVLIDDGGRTHMLIPPPDNEEVTIPPNSRLSGEMYFSGRLDPTAQRLVLSTNDGVGGSTDNQFTGMPVFKIELPVPTGGTPPTAQADAAAAPPAADPAAAPAGTRAVDLNVQSNHPNGAVLLVERLEAGDDGIALTIRASTATQEVRLNWSDNTRMVDDQGNVYRLVPPADNEELRVPANSRIAGKIVFSGRLLPEAQRLTLEVNERGGSSSRSTNIPEFRIALPLGG